MAQPAPRTKLGHQLSFGLASSGITMVLQQSEQLPHCFAAKPIAPDPLRRPKPTLFHGALPSAPISLKSNSPSKGNVPYWHSGSQETDSAPSNLPSLVPVH